MLLRVFLVHILHILFLNMGAVFQHNGAQVCRRFRAVDGSNETLLHERGQIAAVVNVRVRKHNGIDT